MESSLSDDFIWFSSTDDDDDDGDDDADSMVVSNMCRWMLWNNTSRTLYMCLCERQECLEDVLCFDIIVLCFSCNYITVLSL